MPAGASDMLPSIPGTGGPEKVLISPRSVRKIDWANRLMHLDVDRQKVKDSPAYDATMTVDRTYEERFHDHYGGGLPGI